MKKIILVSSCLLFSLLLWMGNCFAKPVDTLTAKTVATHFLASRNAELSRSAQQPRIAYIGQSLDENSHRSVPCYYIVNLNQGFVVLSADDRIEPILGFSTEGHFNNEEIPSNMLAFLDGYSAQIKEFLADAPASPSEATAKWASLIRNDYRPAASKGAVIGPLLETSWDQNDPYNNMCPADASGPGGHVYAGCVATAMAQIIRYWEYPHQGIGTKSYIPSGYSQQNVNFEVGFYDYANMPSSINSSSPGNQITQIAKLTYHCGVSVEMMYGPYGSGASTSYSVNAFKNYFKYSTSYGTINPQYKSRGSYSDAEWINLLKNELDNWRPIIYSASSPNPSFPEYTVGHAFICDGYDDQGYFHFNWGWSGSFNGYYLISLLNPDDYNFYLSHGAVINLQGNTPLIKTNAKEISFLCPTNTVSETKGFPIHGIALTNNIVLTAPANFEVSTDGTTFSSSLNVPNTTSVIYVRYAPTATGVTSDQGTLTLTSGSTTKTVTLYGYTYELDCNAPQNVQYSSSNNGNVQLSWDAPTQDIHSYRFSVDSTISGSRTGLGASNYIFAHRADISNLLPYHLKRVTQVSFYFSAQAAAYSSNRKIVIFQGGSLKNDNLDEGTLIREQAIASISSGWNTITLNEPVIIDAEQELWYGIQFDYNATGYCCPIVLGTNSGVAKKGDLVNADGSWYNLGFFGYNKNIPLKITIQDSPSSITDYTIERNDNILGTTTNTQYNDHVTSSGIYTYNVTANWDNGCSSTSNDIPVNVITNCTTTYGDTTVSACESFTWHDSTYTVTPAAIPTFTMVGGNSVGCDSVVRLHLTINQNLFFPENVTVAQSSLPYNWHGHAFYADTTIYDSLATVAGCDSVFFLTLTITPFNLVQDSPIVLCQGETENWRGRLLSQSGIYQDTIMASNTIYSVVVTVNPKYFFPENVTVPQGSLPYNWHGHSFYTDTTIHDSLTTVAGCDSVFFLALTVTPFNIVQDSPIVLCQGETENWHGHQLSESGTYQDTSLIENTIHTVVVIVNPKYFFPENVTVNQGSLPYNWHGHAFYSDTIAYDSLKTVADCDSVYCLTLTVVPYSVIADTPIAFCEGKTETWRGHLLSQSGIFQDTIFASNTIHTVTVTVNPKYYFPENVTVPQGSLPYNWHGHSFYADTTIYDSLTTVAGCDSVFFLTLTITPFNIVQDSPIVLCQGETENWRGHLLSQPGNYRDTAFAENTIHTVVVTVNPKHFFPESVTANQGSLPYNWHGHSFYADTIAYDSLLTTAGCDSVYCLTLIVVPYSVIADDPIVFCEGETQTWRGHELTESREYRDTVPESNTIYTIQVTIKPLPVFTLTLENNNILCAHETLSFSPSFFYSGNNDDAIWSWEGPNGFTSSIKNPVVSNNATPDENGDYSVTVAVSQNGCTKEDSATVHVTVHAPATGTVAISGSTIICKGSSTMLTASATGNTGDMTYEWSYGLSPISDSAATASPAYSTIYTVTATATVGNCTATTTKQIVVTVNPLPTVTIEGDDTICSGSSGTLTASANSNAPQYSWSWNNGDTTQTTTINEPGTYSVTVTDGNGCQKSTSSTVTALPLPLAPQCSILPNSSCTSDNGSITIINPVGAGFSYSIDGEHFQDSTVFQNLSDGSYNVTVKNSDGCINVTTVSVEAIGNTVDAQATANTPCAGEDITLFGNSSTTDVTYSWVGPNDFASDEQNPVIPNASSEIAGSYYLTVTQASTNCSKTVPVTVQVNTPHTGTVTVSGNFVICLGDSTQLTASATGNIGEMTYVWNIGGNLTASPMVTVSPNAYTSIPITATATVENCTHDTTINVSVTVNPLPTVTIEGDEAICSGTSGTLTAYPDNSLYSWSWSNGDTTQAITVQAQGTYRVTVTDENGCQNSTSATITVLSLPNAPQCSTQPNTSCTSDNGSITITNPVGAGYTYSIDGEHFQANTSFQALSDGSYNVTVKNSDGCINLATVSVDAIGNMVDAQATANTPCAGQNITLFGNSSTTGVTYSWTGPNGFTSNEQNPVISNASSETAGSYFLTVTQTATNCSKSVPVTVQVNTPSVTLANISDTAVCVGGDITLNAALCSEPTGSVTYLWTSEAGYSSTQQNNTIHHAQAVQAGTYEVVATASLTMAGTTCTVTDSKTMSVMVNELPNIIISGENSTCEGVSATWTASGANSYLWSNNSTSNPIQVSDAGTYTVEGTDTNGCVNTASKVLNVNVPQPVTVQHTACESYEWHDSTYTTSGIYTYSHPDAQGCTQVDTLKLTINYGTHNTSAIASCYLYTWNAPSGTTYTTDSTSVLIDHYINTVNCPSADTLTVTINSTEQADLHVSICENELPYHYVNGQIDTTFDVGTPSLLTVPYTLSTVNGCDSIVTLHLTIKNSVSEFVEATACDSYTWNDSTYTESGVYSKVFTAANGCDSTVTLHLTIYSAEHTDLHVSICENELPYHYANGQIDTTFDVGTPSLITVPYTLSTVNGCDSIVTLHLTVNSTEYTDLHESICENELPYHYVNGQIDTTFDVGTPSLLTVPYTLSTVNGCDSIVTLNLTVNPTYAVDTAVTITTNDLPYHFVSGQIDTTFEVGSPSLLTVPYTLSSANGCDSIVTLHLTINVGIENHAAESLRAFPNPTTGYLTVIGSEGLTQLQLFDAYGRRVGIYPVEGTQTEIDLHGLASGVYFLKAMRHNQTAGTLKIIKNNE